MFISVDLPDPDWPMIATNSFRSMRASMPRSAWTFWWPRTYVLTMFSSSMSAIQISGGRKCGASATAALRALRFSCFAGRGHLDALPVLQLARERPVRAVHDGFAVVDPFEDLDVRAAGDPGAHLAHLHLPVLHHEDDLHRLWLSRRRGRRRRIGRRGAGRSRAWIRRHQRPFARGRLRLLLLRLAAGDRLDR